MPVAPVYAECPVEHFVLALGTLVDEVIRVVVAVDELLEVLDQCLAQLMVVHSCLRCSAGAIGG